MGLRKQKPLARGAGILLPVSSLPSPYGIGTFGKAAFAFADFLAKAGQKYWQVLPLGPTSYGDSPYQSFSAFAGNPYFIDLDLLCEARLLQKEEIVSCDWGDDPADVDYAKLYAARFQLLHRAYERSDYEYAPDYQSFCARNTFWLEDYALYMAIKMQQDGKEWLAWPEGLRLREETALAKAREELRQEIGFWKFCQYQFFCQWDSLKSYANRLGIRIIGDIPIYVALDSADVWVNFHLFQLDENRMPTKVAGVPPDMFSATGQLWGNPLYRWDRMEADGFSWWRQRMGCCAQLYDIIRIDHFIGITRYYAIPAQDRTAENGVWVEGPGEKLIEAISQAIGKEKQIIAEDLGVLTPAVERLRLRAGYPGMKLMTFAFDSDAQNDYLPCHFEKNCVAYGGTHDNETLPGFFAHQPRKTLRYAREYLGVRTSREITWGLIRAGYESSADVAIFQMQDFLGLDNRARMNTPSTLGKNWRWRLLPGQADDALAEQLSHLAALYAR